MEDFSEETEKVSEKRKKVSRGDFGYITHQKKKVMIKILFILLTAIAIFLVGYFLNDKSERNIFTVIAVVFVLPWAKQVVAFIVLAPYRSVSEKRYLHVKKSVPQDVLIYTDLVITSSDKIMNLDFMVIGDGQVIALIGKKGQDIEYIRKYLTRGVKNWGDDYKVKIEENEKTFMREASAITGKEIDDEEDENVKSYLHSLIV